MIRDQLNIFNIQQCSAVQCSAKVEMYDIFKKSHMTETEWFVQLFSLFSLSFSFVSFYYFKLLYVSQHFVLNSMCIVKGDDSDSNNNDNFGVTLC